MKRLWQSALVLGVLGIFSLGVVLAYATRLCLDGGSEQAVGQEATRTMGGNTHCRQASGRHVAGVPTLAPPRDEPTTPAVSHQCADQPRAQAVYVHVETDQPGLEIELMDD